MVEEVNVELKDRSYKILIGSGILTSIADFLSPHLVRPKVYIVTDENVSKLHLKELVGSLVSSGIQTSVLTLPAGETTKSWSHLEETVSWLLSEKTERSDLIVAFGGGVIGDLVGFAAAIIRRGVRFVQIPTTLLAQVDSSVGGKTGINSSHGKNLVGAFYQPQLVVADVALLDSLSARDYFSGYAEVAKYGLLGDSKFFDWLEDNAKDMADGDSEKRILAVKHSCIMKAEIVARDEKESGDRALLNLGHTFGHALEAATGYGDRLLHGEGVALGCILAFELSQRMGLCSQEEPSRVRAHFDRLGFKTDLSQIAGLANAEELYSLMGQDKKVVGGTINFILARAIGEAFVCSDVKKSDVIEVLNNSL